MVELGRDLWRLISPTLLLKAGSTNATFCQCSPWPLWAAYSFFSHCHTKKKRKIWCLNVISRTQFGPLPLLVHTTEKTLAHFSSPMRCLYALIRSPLLYNPSSRTLCSPKTSAPRCSPSSMPTPLSYWLAQHARCAHTHPAQGAVQCIHQDPQVFSWSCFPDIQP